MLDAAYGQISDIVSVLGPAEPRQARLTVRNWVRWSTAFP